MATIFIAPSFSNQAGQCRIYITEVEITDARKHYERQPELWLECGIMNSSGRLVCFAGTGDQRQELIDCQPLMAGTSFVL